MSHSTDCELPLCCTGPGFEREQPSSDMCWRSSAAFWLMVFCGLQPARDNVIEANSSAYRLIARPEERSFAELLRLGEHYTYAGLRIASP